MNKFSFYKATSVQEALEQANATVSSTIQPGALDQASVLKAGGIDLLDLMKEGISNPAKLVGISAIPGMADIVYDDKKGVRLGANVTLADIVSNEQIKSTYFALHQATKNAATPQIRNMATLGGNLAQRTRCWYFRSKYHNCFRKTSDGVCYAQNGENQYHAILMNEDCASVHSSSLSTALMAFDAAVEITAKDGKVNIVSMEDFFVMPSVDRTRESILEPDEIITAVLIQPPKDGVKSQYIKMGERESHDWPIADVAVVAEMKDGKCKKARIVLGAAAPVPVLSLTAMDTIKGQLVADDEIALKTGEAAMKGATPLDKNAYKIPIFKTLVKRAVLALA